MPFFELIMITQGKQWEIKKNPAYHAMTRNRSRLTTKIRQKIYTILKKTTITERKHQNQAHNSEELKLNKQIQSRITIQMEKLKTLRKNKNKGKGRR